MTVTRKSIYHPAVADPWEVTDDDECLTGEAYMDREFGPGAWVRDSWCDVFVTYDPLHTGPGIGYLTVDRQRRRKTTVVYPHQVN